MSEQSSSPPARSGRRSAALASSTAAESGPGVRRKRAGLVGAIVGVAAAGVAAGVAVERLVLRRTRNSVDEDPFADEAFGKLPYDETMTVHTADGVPLHVEIIEPLGGVALEESEPVLPTLVFVHGFCLDQGTFHFQRKALDPQLDHPLHSEPHIDAALAETLNRIGDFRMVFYDQPGHGLSGTVPEGEYELPALGEALHDVIEATAPEGPVILVGHSMGGMTIMACAEQFPRLFADRVAGVALISTSGGQLDGSRLAGLPEVLTRAGSPLFSVVNGTMRMTGPVIDRARQAGTDLAWLLTRRYGFGGEKPSAALVSYVEQMNSRTSIETVSRYLRTINSHARYPALRALENIPVLIIVGAKDLITPLAHSEEIARLLPHAEMAVIPDSGHVVMMEHADEVNSALVAFLDRLELDRFQLDRFQLDQRDLDRPERDRPERDRPRP